MTTSDFGADIFEPDQGSDRKDGESAASEPPAKEPRRKAARKPRRKKAAKAAAEEGAAPADAAEPVAEPAPPVPDETADAAAHAAEEDVDRGEAGREAPRTERRRRGRRGGRRRAESDEAERGHAPVPPAERDWVLDEDDDARHAHAPDAGVPDADLTTEELPDVDRDEGEAPATLDDRQEPIAEREETFQGRHRGHRERHRRRGRRGGAEAAERRPGLPAPSPDTEVHGQRIAVFLDLARLEREAASRDAELAFGRLLRHLSRRRHLIRAVAYVTPEASGSIASTLRGSGFDVRNVEGDVLPIAIAVDAMAIAPRVDSVVVLPGQRLLAPLVRSLEGTGVRLETGSFVQDSSQELTNAHLHHDLGEECLIRP